MWDLIIVGGGAAGLWAAGTAAARGRRVLVLEKNNKPGVKILMSGGTRCNITHHCGIQGIMDAFGRQGRFLKPALYELPPSAVVEEFHRLGVETKVEDTGKVFPVSDRAIDVRDALLRRLNAAGAELRSGVAVVDVARTEDGAWQVVTHEETLPTSKVLLCCGGLSYAACGTTGDGYAWARQAGHTVERTFPALTPLLSPATWVHELTGITLPSVEAKVVVEGERNKDPRLLSRGGFLWTHFGCSGPVPMNVSRHVAALAQPQHATLIVDLIPDETEEQVLQRLTQAGKRGIGSILNSWIPKSLSIKLLERAQIIDTTTCSELPRKARLSLIEDLKRLRVPLSGTRGYAKAEVTAGGVSTKEVNPQTMESRCAPGLFLAGEILDVDGPIGGFNFQAAFSTGHLAGLNV
ncbi:BaiN/RdsA family NAD(P)/FAD-dependent oxidoreductase [Aureliella helgolandensis]|uniref:Tricarballylate dehydrogenase n=1 Tax=Aureliella helgolandensis TaxID=2527968 RepID=A0A518G086_9BACT|nr:NAD(P)/FAD-dependent oxidoreductase [Aureliella helgolandensis]QDV22009.1 tricarballylate dehydrogenase [Aureliella helgolandensis]